MGRISAWHFFQIGGAISTVNCKKIVYRVQSGRDDDLLPDSWVGIELEKVKREISL